MRIVIRLSIEENRNLTSDDITKALEVLRAAGLRPEGGGTVVGLGSDAYGVLILGREEDTPEAIAALTRAGIQASES